MLAPNRVGSDPKNEWIGVMTKTELIILMTLYKAPQTARGIGRKRCIAQKSGQNNLDMNQSQ